MTYQPDISAHLMMTAAAQAAEAASCNETALQAATVEAAGALAVTRTNEPLVFSEAARQEIGAAFLQLSGNITDPTPEQEELACRGWERIVHTSEANSLDHC